jgi:hypothetical protein
MKKIFSISVLLFIFSLTAQAQQEKVEAISQYFNPNFKKSPLFTYYYKDINNYFVPFIGKWIYQNGSQTFVVQFSKQEKTLYQSENSSKYFMDELIGHYKLVQNYGTPNEQTLYTSQINAGNSITPWITIIFGAPLQQYILDGTIYDVNIPYTDDNPLGLKGILKMSINPVSINNAQWTVTLPSGLHNSANASTFTIPTNITLTKVN